jgi:hypothetical protein
MGNGVPDLVHSEFALTDVAQDSERLLEDAREKRACRLAYGQLAASSRTRTEDGAKISAAGAKSADDHRE